MKHRYDFIYLFDVADANPNGDPDAGNLPRLDTETNQGLVTDVCLKRKVRNYVQATRTDERHQIFVRERIPLNPLIKQAAEANKLPTFETGKGWDTRKAKARSVKEIHILQQWLCERYFDIRTFGAVMSTGPNAGQVRGPAQIAFARSVDPVVLSEHAITRLTDVDKEEGEMGRKFTVPYALYQTHGTINPFLADNTNANGNQLGTGFTEGECCGVPSEKEDSDLELLFQALEHAFDFDASAARPAGSMAPRGLLVFRHESKRGNAPAHELYERLQIEPFAKLPATDGKPPRSFADYTSRITFDGKSLDEVVERGKETDLGNGVTMIRRI